LSPPSRAICTLLIVISGLCLIFAVQAGYQNLATGRHRLWKGMYRDVAAERDAISMELARTLVELRTEKENLRDMQVEMDGLKDYLSSLSAEKESLLARNSQLNQTLSELTYQYCNSSESLALLQRQADDLKILLEESAAQLAESRATCAVLEEMLAGAYADIEGLNRNISSIMQELESLTASNERLLGLYNDSSARLRQFEDAISLAGEIYRDYDWFYLGQRHWSKGASGLRGTGFNRSEYIALAVGPHYSDAEEESFIKVLQTPCNDVELLADYLYGQAATDLQRVNNILKFVQYLPYIYDAPDQGYVRHPLETLVEGGGDCEDTSVLAARLMRSAGSEGYPVVLLLVDTNGDGEEDHMMVGVSVAGASGDFYEVNGTKYYVCETTSTTYGVGFKPSNYRITRAISVN